MISDKHLIKGKPQFKWADVNVSIEYKRIDVSNPSLFPTVNMVPLKFLLRILKV